MAIITGDANNNTLTGDVNGVPEADTIKGLGGNDNLFGFGGDDQLFGGEGNDILGGGLGADSLFGGEGNDSLAGLLGADSLDGGAGIDCVSYVGSTGGVSVNLTTGFGLGGDADGDTLSGIENVVGTIFDDFLVGDEVANGLTGLDGIDILQGQGGDDMLNGGAGSDVLDGGAGIDTVSYAGSSEGVGVNLGLNSGGGGDTLTSIENADGSSFRDFLFGDNNGTIGNRLRGFGGEDQINGFAGQDLLDGGNDNDQILGGAGEDTVIGGAGSDVLNGESGFDTVSYATSAAAVDASLATDTAVAGGNGETDAIIEFESLIGSAFGDRLFGDNGANFLSGLKGADEISGGGGNDLLVGGKGGDVLTGGAGADTFDFNKLSDSRARLGAGDFITDFVEGLDVIDLGEIDADTGRAGDQAFRFISYDAFSGTAGELRFELDGIFTRVQGDVDGNGKADLEITVDFQLAGAVGDWVL